MPDSTADRQERFLEAFVERRGDLDAARRDCNVPKTTFYRWLADETFRGRFDGYRIALAEEVEDEAVRRVLSPEGQRGSDTLAAVLLKGLKKERYSSDDVKQQAVQVVYVSGLRHLPRPGVKEPEELPAGLDADPS